MRTLPLILFALLLTACGSPQRRLASEVRATAAKVQKTEERVRTVERTIVDREALPLARMTLGLLEIAREKIPNPPVSFTMATGAALRTYDRLTRAAGPLDPEDERRVELGLQAARAADAEPPLPGTLNDAEGAGKPPVPPPPIFKFWDERAGSNNAELSTAKRERAEMHAKSASVMAKAADQIEADAEKEERMGWFFGLGGLLHYGGRFLFALTIGAGLLALLWMGLRVAFPALNLASFRKS